MKLLSLLIARALIILLCVTAFDRARAEEFGRPSAAAQNILVAVRINGRCSVREYTLSGVFVRKVTFYYNDSPYPTGESLGDLVVDENGIVNAFNGTGSPFLTRYDPADASFTHANFPGWNRDRGGGIATYQGQYVYVSDSPSYGAGAPSGIVRFDLARGTATRFADGLTVLDLSVAAGKLFVLHTTRGEAATHINVYDPRSMALLQQMPLAGQVNPLNSIRRMAVGNDGRIYLCGFGSSNAGFFVYQLSPAGITQQVANAGSDCLSDIAVNDAGVVVIVCQLGSMIVTDTAFSSFQTLSMDLGLSFPSSAFVTLAPPLPAPPPQQLERAFSRKIHGAAGAFDLELPLVGPPAVECRAATEAGTQTVILRFRNQLATVTQASVSQGIGQYYWGWIGADPHEYVLNLAGVADRQKITATLSGVTDIAGNYVPQFSVTFSCLSGDANGSSTVNSTDVSYVKANAGTVLTEQNFPADLNADGVINATDISFAKSLSGGVIP